jgi:hypothetical protein
MEGTHLKIDAQWRLRFEARVHPSPWSGPGHFCISDVVGQSPLPVAVRGVVGVPARSRSFMWDSRRYLTALGVDVALSAFAAFPCS